MGIKVTGVNNEHIIIKVEDVVFFLTPKEILEGIQELRKSLFRWHGLTGKQLGEKSPS